MFRVVFSFQDGSTEEGDEVFDSWEDAEQYAVQWISDYHAGGEVLHLSNPFDYPNDEDEDVEFDVIED